MKIEPVVNDVGAESIYGMRDSKMMTLDYFTEKLKC